MRKLRFRLETKLPAQDYLMTELGFKGKLCNSRFVHLRKERRKEEGTKEGRKERKEGEKEDGREESRKQSREGDREGD